MKHRKYHTWVLVVAVVAYFIGAFIAEDLYWIEVVYNMGIFGRLMLAMGSVLIFLAASVIKGIVDD